MAPVAAIESSGDALAVHPVSDSTRGGNGSGAVDFEAQFDALLRIVFDGPVIMECLPPTHDSVSPVSSEGNRRVLEDETLALAGDLAWLLLRSPLSAVARFRAAAIPT